MLSTIETEYIVISETVKNVIITCRILHELSIISENFAFLLLIDNTSVIVISEDEKVTRNARHINICYHHIQNLVEKKIIEISHILTDEMTVNDLTKTLLSNKFKEFIELIRVSKIEASNKPSNSEPNDGEPSNSEPNNSDKNDKNFVANYYEEADKEAEAKEVSFKTKETE